MRMKQLLANYRQNKLLYWLILPSLIFILIFNYIPMGGLIIAFSGLFLYSWHLGKRMDWL